MLIFLLYIFPLLPTVVFIDCLALLGLSSCTAQAPRLTAWSRLDEEFIKLFTALNKFGADFFIVSLQVKKNSGFAGESIETFRFKLKKNTFAVIISQTCQSKLKIITKVKYGNK